MSEEIKALLDEELQAQVEGKSHAELMDMVDAGQLTEEQLDLIMNASSESKPKKKGSRKKKKHEGTTKICQCIVSGKDVEVSKFMSCDKVYHPDHMPEEVKRTRSKSVHEGPTKICKCIVSGLDVEVSKFMSCDKVYHPDHKPARTTNRVPRTKVFYQAEEWAVGKLEELRTQKALSFRTTEEGLVEVSAVPALHEVVQNALSLVITELPQAAA